MPRSKATPIQNLEAKAANAKEIAVTVARKAPRLERGLAPTVQLYSAEKSKPEQLTPILCFRVYLKAMHACEKPYMLNINGMLHPISPCLLGVNDAGSRNDTVGLSRGAVVCSSEKSFLSFFDPKNLPLLSACFKSQLISLSMNIDTMKLYRHNEII